MSHDLSFASIKVLDKFAYIIFQILCDLNL